jgi:hypothetical protein
VAMKNEQGKAEDEEMSDSDSDSETDSDNARKARKAPTAPKLTARRERANLENSAATDAGCPPIPLPSLLLFFVGRPLSWTNRSQLNSAHDFSNARPAHNTPYPYRTVQ